MSEGASLQGRRFGGCVCRLVRVGWRSAVPCCFFFFVQKGSACSFGCRVVVYLILSYLASLSRCCRAIQYSTVQYIPRVVSGRRASMSSFFPHPMRELAIPRCRNSTRSTTALQLSFATFCLQVSWFVKIRHSLSIEPQRSNAHSDDPSASKGRVSVLHSFSEDLTVTNTIVDLRVSSRHSRVGTVGCCGRSPIDLCENI